LCEERHLKTLRVPRGWPQLTFVAKIAPKVDLRLILGNKEQFPSCDVSLSGLSLSYSRWSLRVFRWLYAVSINRKSE